MKLAYLLTVTLLATSLLDAGLDRNQILRGELQNSLVKFEKEKVGTVAFMGGSITEMNGYRPIIGEWLQNRFPDTKFTFINAGISSTCSTTGSFRLPSHVLSHNPDLFFVEFAVNDDQDAHHTFENAHRGMDGILRHARTSNPNMDIVCTHFVNPGMLELIQAGKTPVSIAAHEKALEYYNVPSNYTARELADRIKAGKTDWKEYGGVHPRKPGNTLAANGAIAILEEAWKKKPSGATKPHPVPGTPQDPGSYFNGHFLPSCSVDMGEGVVRHIPDWKAIKGSFRNTFAGMQLFCAEKPGQTMTVKFEGNTLAAYVLAGPDAGILEISVEGGTSTKTDLYHHHSRGLHYPRTVILAENLSQGSHTAIVTVSKDHNEASQGTAARILEFGVNNPE
jgi:lysophospholipase L1-like esterase